MDSVKDSVKTEKEQREQEQKKKKRKKDKEKEAEHIVYSCEFIKGQALQKRNDEKSKVLLPRLLFITNPFDKIRMINRKTFPINCLNYFYK